MNLAVVCPECGHAFKVAEKYAGRKGRCPNPDCGKTYIVPQPPRIGSGQWHGGPSHSQTKAAQPAACAPVPLSFLRRIDQPSFLMGLSTTAVITICALIVWSWLPVKTPGGGEVHASADIVQDQPPAPPPRNVFGEDILPILHTHCAKCHVGDDAQGGFVLTDFRDEPSILKHRRQWERLTNLISTGIMPPADEPQPTAEEKTKLLDFLESTLFRLDCAQITDPGRVTIRRLNRYEYNRTVRDLLGVDFRPADDFPSDDVGHGFDNIGDMLSLPPLLMEKYLAAAEKIAGQVILTFDPTNPPRTILADKKLQRGPATHDHALGVIIVSFGHVGAEWEAPIDGTYSISIDAAETPAGDEHAKMELVIDDRSIQTFEVKNGADQLVTFEHKLHLTRGKHQLLAKFLNDFYDPKNENRRRRDRNLIVAQFQVRGPLDVDPNILPARHKQLIAVHPRDGKSNEACLQANLSRFLPKAFRRPVTEDELRPFVALGLEALKQGETFEFAMQTVLTAVLVSPQFLFRVETDRNPLDPNDKHPLNDYELASRLSYFLWSSMPDDELFQHAAKGDLHTDAVLEAQVKRMLADSRATALVESFAEQWLNLRILDDFHPDPEKFKDFDAALKADLKRETQAFVEHVIRGDRSVLEFLDGPYTFVNQRLAQLYGLADVSGDEFRQVSLAGTPRAGLLTHGSILALTSMPTRTSPVKRGKWMLEVILDQPPPPPPPNVPELTETAKASPDATLRQQLELHRANPVCNSCHQTMDALGFGMENFDPIGRWRDNVDGKPLDTTGELPGGKTFNGPKELMAVLKQRDCDFAKAFTGKLLTYALGRGLEYYDRCAIDTIVKTLKEKDFKFSVLACEIVKSRPFRMRRGEELDP